MIRLLLFCIKPHTLRRVLYRSGPHAQSHRLRPKSRTGRPTLRNCRTLRRLLVSTNFPRFSAPQQQLSWAGEALPKTSRALLEGRAFLALRSAQDFDSDSPYFVSRRQDRPTARKKRWRHGLTGSHDVVPKASIQIQTPYKATCPSYHRRRRLVLNACALSAS